MKMIFIIKGEKKGLNLVLTFRTLENEAKNAIWEENKLNDIE